MKSLKIGAILLGLMLSSVVPSPVQAQYAVKNSLFGNGNGKLGSGSYQLHGSAGQPMTGRLGNAANNHRLGFWEIPPSLVAPAQVALGGATQPGFTPTLDWSNGFAVTGYTLEYAGDAGFTGATTLTGISASQYTFPSPLADGTYFWRVKAVGPCSQSGSSATDSFVIIPTFTEWTVFLLAAAMMGYALRRQRNPMR